MDKAARLGFRQLSGRLGISIRAGLLTIAVLGSLLSGLEIAAAWESAPVKVLTENESTNSSLSEMSVEELAALLGVDPSTLKNSQATPDEGPLPDGADPDEFTAPDRVVLNADRVFFNDETGAATAEGEAVLTYGGTVIEADRIDYDADTQKVDALSLPDKQVILTHTTANDGTYSVKGEHLNYDLITNEGVLSGTSTKIAAGEGALYIHGENLNVMPWELAKQQGLIRNQKGTFEDYIAQWHDVALTTCALEHPHYRLESKTISFVPGRSIVAKKPRIYLGNTYLFTSPFDYVMPFNRRATTFSILPYAQHSGAAGSGAGITGVVAWETGSFAVGVSYSNRGGFGYLFELEQDLNDEFSVILGTTYSWDKAWDESIWRPYSSLNYRKNGWYATLKWSKNEYISDQKDSLHNYKGRLDRRPELVVTSPWFKTSPWSWSSFEASIGSYKERTPEHINYTDAEASGKVINRAGLELRNYFERSLSPTVQFFSNLKASVWLYDLDDADQEILWSFTGLRYRIGDAELGTAYERRDTWGESAMLWDQYRDRERIHQKVRFHVGGEFYALLRGSYDLKESMVDETFYCLQWITDCMKWELYMLDDRTSDNDDKIGVTLSILAFPDSRASFGQKVLVDPFDPPKGLKVGQKQ